MSRPISASGDEVVKPSGRVAIKGDVSSVPLGNAPANLLDDQELGRFLERLGRQVREIRVQRKLSAKQLSSASGVSLRSLSLLENGRGNISIGLLYRIAAALGLNLAQLISHTPASSGTDPGKARRVALIGLRGAGKSTLGQSVAETLALPFVELTEKVEVLSGMPVPELIGLYGQEGYRRLENEAIEQIVSTVDTVVMAVAGGIVGSEKTFDLLQQRFHTIWLKAAPEEHMERVRAQGDHRPMAGNPGALQDLKSLLIRREVLYADADYQIDTSGRSQSRSARDLLQVIREIL